MVHRFSVICGHNDADSGPAEWDHVADSIKSISVIEILKGNVGQLAGSSCIRRRRCS